MLEEERVNGRADQEARAVPAELQQCAFGLQLGRLGSLGLHVRPTPRGSA